MGTIRHPITGVILNEVVVRRKALGPDEAETARLLRQDGHKHHDIAAMLGTNPGRVADVLGPTGEVITESPRLL